MASSAVTDHWFIGSGIPILPGHTVTVILRLQCEAAQDEEILYRLIGNLS